MKIWHYTTYPAFLNIWEEKQIRSSHVTAHLGIFKGPKVVWLSTNPIWEQSVRKVIQPIDGETVQRAFNRDELHRRGCFPVRLSTNDRLSEIVSWGKAKKQMGLKRDQIREIESVTKVWGGNIAEWWVSPKALPMAQVLLPIEIWDGREWTDIETFDFT